MCASLNLAAPALTLHLQSQGVTTAHALADALGVDRSTVSRGLTALGQRVVRLGAARQSRYALRRSVRSAGSRWPLYRIDEAGRAGAWGTLHALHGGFWLEATAAPAWFQPGYARGLFPGLPFCLADLRPQGFLGRAAARSVQATLQLPEDPRNWTDDDTLCFLLAEGGDLPGDWVMGERMLERVLQRRAAPVRGLVVAERQRATQFPLLADAAMQGTVTGSSAGGEQPKFTATIASRGDAVRQVMVKFSPPLNTPAGRRWADLLAAEWHALRLLAEHDHEAATARLVEGGGRRFLEVTRFDRAGTHGRRGVLSLAAVEGGLIDEPATTWPSLATAMEAAGLLGPADVAALRLRWCFGRLTGNTDMHLGNASVWFGDRQPFRLAPAYDMLPMVWAPGPQGEIVPRTFAPPPPLPGDREAWQTVAPWALEYWQRVQTDRQISAAFRALAHSARIAVEAMRQQFL